MCQPPERIRSAQAIRRHPSLGVSCNLRPGVPGPESTFGPAACSLAASGRSLSTGVLGPLPRQRVRTSRPGPSLSTRTGDVGRPITLVPVPPTPAGGTTTLIGSPPCRSGRRRIAGRLPTFAACGGTLSAVPRSVSTAVLTCGCTLLAQASAQFHVVNTRDIPWLLFVGWACHGRRAECGAQNALKSSNKRNIWTAIHRPGATNGPTRDHAEPEVQTPPPPRVHGGASVQVNDLFRMRRPEPQHHELLSHGQLWRGTAGLTHFEDRVIPVRQPADPSTTTKPDHPERSLRVARYFPRWRRWLRPPRVTLLRCRGEQHVDRPAYAP